MSEQENLGFQKGKRKRETLRLPTLHYVAADNWMGEIGYEGFCVWLKFHTWVNRTDESRKYDSVPMSFEKLFKKLDVSKSKFFRLLKPLWEFGLVDVVEYEDTAMKGTKPKNIVVYEYPLHDETKMFKPLEKLRDWDKDYQSSSKELGKTGGRPKKSDVKDQVDQEEPKQEEEVHQPGFKIETGEGFKIETGTVSEMKPNNVSNIFNNSQISINNNQIKHLSIQEKINKLDIPTRIVDFLKDQKQIDRLIFHKINLKEIEWAFNSFRGKVGHDQFEQKLFLALDHGKYDYKTGFKGYLERCLNNIVNGSDAEYYQRVQQDQEDGQEEEESRFSRYDFSVKKKEYEERIKGMTPFEDAQNKLLVYGWDNLPVEYKAILDEHGMNASGDQVKYEEVGF